MSRSSRTSAQLCPSGLSCHSAAAPLLLASPAGFLQQAVHGSPLVGQLLVFCAGYCALEQPLQTVPAKHDSFMPKVQMLVLLCGAAAAVLAMHHATKADCRHSEQTHKQRGHLAAPEGVAISLRAATMLLLFPSRALTACTSPSSLAMPCKAD